MGRRKVRARLAGRASKAELRATAAAATTMAHQGLEESQRSRAHFGPGGRRAK